MNYKIVKLKKEKEKYKKVGLIKDSLGLILKEKNEQCLTMFFNSVNQGDYLIIIVSKFDLQIVDTTLPKTLCYELEEYIKNNAEKIANKTNFNEIPFQECDQVVLISQKERYAKFGLQKGDMGIVALNKATKNKILVDFGNQTEQFDGFVLVDFEDIKKV